MLVGLGKTPESTQLLTVMLKVLVSFAVYLSKQNCLSISFFLFMGTKLSYNLETETPESE